MVKIKTRKKKIRWKAVLSFVLVLGVLIGSIAGISAIAKKDTKTISPGVFSRGALDENGKYVASDQSIYTKEAFGCLGLSISQNFESKITYDVFYYDYDDRLIEVKRGLSGVYDEDYPLAMFCRIVIHPEIPADTKKEDFKIKWYEVRSYAKELKITVDKEQKYLYDNSVNLYVEANAIYGKTFDSTIHDGTVTFEDNENFKVTEKITVTDEFNMYDVYIRRSLVDDSHLVSVIAASADDRFLVRESYHLSDLEAGEWCKLTLEIPEYEEGMYLIARMPKDSECYIFGYNN